MCLCVSELLLCIGQWNENTNVSTHTRLFVCMYVSMCAKVNKITWDGNKLSASVDRVNNQSNNTDNKVTVSAQRLYSYTVLCVQERDRECDAKSTVTVSIKTGVLTHSSVNVDVCACVWRLCVK